MAGLLYISQLLLTVPVVGFVAVLLVYRLLCFLEYSHIVSLLALKDLGKKHRDLFLTLKCFLVLFGFPAALFLVSLYFYTSTFSAIVSFFRTPLFLVG